MVSASYLAGCDGLAVLQLVCVASVTLAGVDVPHPVRLTGAGRRGGHCGGGAPLLSRLAEKLLGGVAVVVRPGPV